VLLPLAVWLARRDEIIAATLALGVWLDSDEGPEALAGDLDRFAVIGVNFPKFTDGRSYSSARLLRERYRYAARSAPSATCCRTSSSTCAAAASTPTRCGPTRTSKRRSPACRFSATPTRRRPTSRNRCSGGAPRRSAA
jgi:hypothetical protein